MTSSPPTRAKSPHAAEGPRLPNPGNGRSTPYHDGRRPQSWWQATATEDLSSGNPVLPGSDWVIPEGPRTEGTPARTHLELANSRARVSPHAPR